MITNLLTALILLNPNIMLLFEGLGLIKIRRKLICENSRV